MRVFLRFCLLFPIATLACGSRAIDLNGAGVAITASPDPTVLGTVRESVGQIAVDDTRVYWLGVDQGITDVYGQQADIDAVEWTLYGCDKTRCASTLVTYSTQVAAGTGFGVRGGQIYWFDVPGGTSINVMASSTTGAPAPRTIATEEDEDWTDAVAFFDDDAIYYYTNSEIRALALPDGGSSKTLATLPAQPALTLSAQGDYLYWIAALAQLTGSIQRTRKDGTSVVETLADSLQIDALADPVGPRGGLALDSSYFYWVESVLVGSIKRCPLAGCVGAPEALLSPVRSPTGIWLAGTDAYFLHEMDAYSNVISRCTIENCAPIAPLAVNVDSPNLFAVDDQYLYTATTSQSLAPTDHPPSPVAQIRRLSK